MKNGARSLGRERKLAVDPLMPFFVIVVVVFVLFFVVVFFAHTRWFSYIQRWKNQYWHAWSDPCVALVSQLINWILTSWISHRHKLRYIWLTYMCMAASALQTIYSSVVWDFPSRPTSSGSVQPLREAFKECDAAMRAPFIFQLATCSREKSVLNEGSPHPHPTTTTCSRDKSVLNEEAPLIWLHSCSTHCFLFTKKKKGEKT